MREWGVRLFIYVLGVWVLTFGSVLSINANLGLSAINCLPYALTRVTGISFGTGLIIVYALLIGLQYALLGRDFRVGNLLQFPVSFLCGFFADFWVWVFGGFVVEAYWARILVLGTSLVFVGIGIALYVTPGIMPNPVEGAAIAGVRRFGRPFSLVKVLLDSSSVALAVCIGLLCLGGVAGVREGTVASALLTGKAAGCCFRITRPLVAWLAGTDAFLEKAGEA